LPDGLSEIFFARGLDDPNQLESANEKAVYAQAILQAPRLASDCDSRKIAPDFRSMGK